jgi:Kef-type K+ transport system membrane component KefB
MISLLLILVAAWFMGSLFRRYGLPFVLGELVAGIIIGPPLLGLIAPSPALELLGELGIFFVMFHTGMELDPKELLEHFWPSLSVAVGGFILPFALGYFTTSAFGGTVYQSLFVGMGISITAIAVQSVILHSLRISTTYIGHIIIGAAIADDILSLIGLSILLSLARTGTVDPSMLFMIVGKVIGFFAFTSPAGFMTVKARHLPLPWPPPCLWPILPSWSDFTSLSAPFLPASLCARRSWTAQSMQKYRTAFMA